MRTCRSSNFSRDKIWCWEMRVSGKRRGSFMFFGLWRRCQRELAARQTDYEVNVSPPPYQGSILHQKNGANNPGWHQVGRR